MLRDRLVGAENAVVDVMVVDRDCCLNRQMRPDHEAFSKLPGRKMHWRLASLLDRSEQR